MELKHHFNESHLLGMLSECNISEATFDIKITDIPYQIIKIHDYVVIYSPYYPILGEIINLSSKNKDILENRVLSIKSYVKIKYVGYFRLENQKITFESGIREHPFLGTKVYQLNPSWNEIVMEYLNKNEQNDFCIKIGQSIAFKTDYKPLLEHLISRHLGIFGMTGSGKSWSIAKIIETILNENISLKVILFECTGEWEECFSQFNTVEVVERKDIKFAFQDLSFQDFETLLRPSDTVQYPLLIKLYQECKSVEYQECKSVEYQKCESVDKSPDFNTMLDKIEEYLNESINKIKSYNSSHVAPLKTRIMTYKDNEEFKNHFFYSKAISIKTKMNEFLKNQEKKLMVIKLKDVSKEYYLQEMIFDLLSNNLLKLAKEEKEISPENPCLIIADEAHQFFGKFIQNAEDKRFFTSFSNILKEGRKYGLLTCLATQQPRDIPHNALSQIGCVFLHRLINEQDQKILKQNISSITEKKIESLANFSSGEMLITGTKIKFPLHIQVERPKKVQPASADIKFKST